MKTVALLFSIVLLAGACSGDQQADIGTTDESRVTSTTQRPRSVSTTTTQFDELAWVDNLFDDVWNDYSRSEQDEICVEFWLMPDDELIQGFEAETDLTQREVERYVDLFYIECDYAYEDVQIAYDGFASVWDNASLGVRMELCDEWWATPDDEWMVRKDVVEIRRLTNVELMWEVC
jgi:hypothetical protein